MLGVLHFSAFHVSGDHAVSHTVSSLSPSSEKNTGHQPFILFLWKRLINSRSEEPLHCFIGLPLSLPISTSGGSWSMEQLIASFTGFGMPVRLKSMVPDVIEV